MKNEQERIERELRRMYWIGRIAFVAYLLFLAGMVVALIHFILKFW